MTTITRLIKSVAEAVAETVAEAVAEAVAVAPHSTKNEKRVLNHFKQERKCNHNERARKKE
jgi:L-aminopeptidase/D-esterase-like protein